MRRITLESQRMSGLVDGMLRLARLDHHPEQHHDLVDLTDLVQASAERAQVADPARAWRTVIAPGLVVTGDEELLRRAVENLLSNVRAHTPPAPRPRSPPPAGAMRSSSRSATTARASRPSSFRGSSTASTGPRPRLTAAARASAWPL